MFRSRRSRGTSPIRTLPPRIECLEARELLHASRLADLAQAALRPAAEVKPQDHHEVRQHHDHGQSLLATASHQTAVVMHPLLRVHPLVTNSTPPAGAYTPSQIRTAYGFDQIQFGNGVKGDGTGQTIAIVDAYDDPNIGSDLTTFDNQYGLTAPPKFTKFNQTGTDITTPGTNGTPMSDPTGGWAQEVALNVEWVHAMAPGANIVLIEANSPSTSNMLAAVDTAKELANVVSMSWGGAEYAGETSDDPHFVQSGVTFVTASGDSGAPPLWPAISPNVVAVGGTTLKLNSNNTWSRETGWSGSGGGVSAFESQPAYQKGVVTQSMTMRTNPDVAYNADPNPGYAVYDSVTYYPYSLPILGQSGWFQVGGTSAGEPQWSALIAIANQERIANGKQVLNTSSAQATQAALYTAFTTPYHDITSGSSTGNPPYTAGPGYNLVTGLGSPKANAVVQTLMNA